MKTTNELESEAGPFAGHILVASDTMCVLRRLSDAMIVFYDRDTTECRFVNNASELMDYLDDEEYQAVLLALYKISHKLLH
jgi:hypothetical protein